MKRKILPIVISSLAAMTTQAAFADIDLYGKINLTLQTEEESVGDDGSDTRDSIALNSNASRLGFKGSEEINEALQVIYKLEYEIYPDSGDSGNGKGNDAFEQRNSYLGLSGDFGTVLAGKHDTPLKMSQGKIDQFNDLYIGDIKNVISGEVRASNTVMYKAPTKDGFSGAIALIQGEENGVADDNSDDRNGLGDGISGAVTYNMDALYLALALDQDVGGADRIRLVAQYSVDNFTVGGIYQTAESSDTDRYGDIDETGLVLSGTYDIDAWKLKLQYSTNNEDDNNANNDSEADITLLTFGADYKISKTTKVFGYYSTWTEEFDGPAKDDEKDTIAIGVEHKF